MAVGAKVPAAIPAFDLARQTRDLAPEVTAAIADVVRSGRFVPGPCEERLERERAARCGVAHDRRGVRAGGARPRCPHLASHVRVGAGTHLGQGVYVDAGVGLGSRVQVQNGVSLYHGLTVEDYVFIGPHAAFTNDLHPRAFRTDWTATPTRVRRGTSIGANATIVCGAEIGAFAMVAAGAVVSRNVAPFTLVAGVPARRAAWVCVWGQPRRRPGPCEACGRPVP